MNGVNINLFQFDYDLTWMAFFMDADDRFYARYGGRGGGGRAGRGAAGRPGAGGGGAPRGGKDPAERVRAGRPPRTPEEIPPMRAMIARREVSCIHCHDVKVATLRDLQDRGRFDR